MEKERYSNVDKEDEFRTKESKTQKEAMVEISMMNISQNIDRKSSFYEGYRKGSKSSFQRQ